jgi:hypothetical protein
MADLKVRVRFESGERNQLAKLLVTSSECFL